MGVLRRFLPKMLLIGLFLAAAIFPVMGREAGSATDLLTPEERIFVAAHGPIRYAPDPLFPPFEFLDSSGVARGITPDLLFLMGRKLGVEFHTVAYATWSDVLEAVKRGEVDLLGTLTRTPEREGFLLFSRPYLSVPYVLFVRKDGDDPKTIEEMISRRLGVVRNYGINTWLSAEHPNIHPVEVEDTATGLTMVATGQLDAMLETLPVGAHIVHEKSLTNIRMVPRHIYTLPQHFGVRKGEPLLLSIVQKGLDSLTETERSGAFVRWTGQDFSRPPPAISPLLRNALLLLAAAAVLSWVWIVSLRRSVRRATQSLRESEERYRDLFENANDIIYTHDLAGNFTSINKAAEQIIGYTNDEVVKSNILSVVAPEHADIVRRMISRKIAEGGITQYELEIVCKNGRRIPLEVSTRIICSGGKPVGVQGIARDITYRKRAEAEKGKLQAQLQQAMKMEAVGRLAGGVAHDFNNLLTVVTGYSELLLQQIGKESSLHREVEEIQRAGERAASLTQQLLAFSRKQIIEPKVVRLDRLVAEVQTMLTRLIGEDIALQTATGESPGSVKIDPGQFQQILMNLVLNSRDAMPGGGKIVIETANVDLDESYCATHPYVTPGRFVMLAISDTGQGMSDEVKEHVFEPFFTTKERGRGTGLGLATTYGAVKQSGGSIEVSSEVGIGTTIKIYLPRVEEDASPPVKDGRPQDMRGGSESVLLVEDEDAVRNLGVQILERLGYRVLQARNGAEAIALAQGYGDRIDLLLTDVVMPGMSGRELATALVLQHPEMRVLYTSGYTDDAIGKHGVLDEGVSFIGKPYTPLALARKVREVIDKA